MFVHMTRDRKTEKEIHAQMKVLKANGVTTKEVRILPEPVTRKLLSSCMGHWIAEELLKELREDTHLYPDYMVRHDPRSRNRPWTNTVKRILRGRVEDSLVEDESCVAQLMNVAWADHEFVAREEK